MHGGGGSMVWVHAVPGLGWMHGDGGGCMVLGWFRPAKKTWPTPYLSIIIEVSDVGMQWMT